MQFLINWGDLLSAFTHVSERYLLLSKSNQLSLQSEVKSMDDNWEQNEDIPFYSPITMAAHNQYCSTVLIHSITKNISRITFHHFRCHIIHLTKHHTYYLWERVDKINFKSKYIILDNKLIIKFYFEFLINWYYNLNFKINIDNFLISRNHIFF